MDSEDIFSTVYIEIRKYFFFIKSDFCRVPVPYVKQDHPERNSERYFQRMNVLRLSIVCVQDIFFICNLISIE